MAFIAQFKSNWADEMNIFGLRYFDSMDDYLKEFCWSVPFDFLDIDIPRALDFLGIEYDHEYWYREDYEKKMIDYFIAHPKEMRTRYIEIFDDYSFEDVENPYINFIYLSFLIEKEDNEYFDDTAENYSIHVGSNQSIPMSLWDYLDFLEPDIFAEGITARAITQGDKNYSAGIFYM